jgi:hypothetical protein
MNTQPHRTHGLLALFATSVLVLTLIAVWLPRADRLWSISSNEIDELLYRNLDDYQSAIDRSEYMQQVMRKALTEPATLSDDEKILYVELEHRFFGGWEMVFNYGEGGYLAEDRFATWDSWYRSEMERRPGFAWTENKPAYSAAFAAHVEGTAAPGSIRLSDCGAAAGTNELSGTMASSTDDDCGARTPANNR